VRAILEIEKICPLILAYCPFLGINEISELTGNAKQEETRAPVTIQKVDDFANIALGLLLSRNLK
jgi:hypothetical protein